MVKSIDESGIRRAFEGRLMGLLSDYNGAGNLSPNILCQYRDTKAQMYDSLKELHTGQLREHYQRMALLLTRPLSEFTDSA